MESTSQLESWIQTFFYGSQFEPQVPVVLIATPCKKLGGPGPCGYQLVQLNIKWKGLPSGYD